jgi:transcriptional regulator with GAF, ATPase, and Fis domain
MNPRLVALCGPRQGTTYPISEDLQTIGRAPENDIQLDDEMVSRQEAVVQMREGRAVAMDRGSRNGIWINGDAYWEQPLVHGDIWQIGSSIFIYLDLEVSADELPVIQEEHVNRLRRRETLRADHSVRDEAAIYYRGVNEGWVKVVGVLDSLPDVEPVPARLLDIVVEMIPQTRRAACLLNGSRSGPDPEDFTWQTFRDKAKAGYNGDSRTIHSSLPFAWSSSVTRSVYSTRQPYLSNMTTPAVLCVPLFAGETIRGVFYLEAQPDGRSGFETEQLKYLQGVAKVAVASLNLAQKVERVQHKLEVLKEENESGDDLVGDSKVVQNIRSLVLQAAESDISVLIIGETGTGKERVAGMIHAQSRRANCAFVPVNCAAVPATLFESEFFGHAKGSFTGATEARDGKFKMADGGTLLLDEIGELELSLQPKLLRVLQDQTFEPVGGKRQIQSNARIIASTNANLDEKVRRNEFRADLFHRLNVFVIQLPPLRERTGDIPALIAHFIQKHRGNKAVREVAPDAIQCLLRYPWPGNVRELENVIQCAVVMTKSGTIGIAELPSRIVTTRESVDSGTMSLKVSIEDATREQIERALQQAGGNVREAAKLLHINKRTLYRRMKDLNI